MAFDGAPKGFEDVVAALEAPNKPPGDDDGAGVADPNKPPPVVPGVAAPNKPPAGLEAGAAPNNPPLVVAGVAAALAPNKPPLVVAGVAAALAPTKPPPEVAAGALLPNNPPSAGVDAAGEAPNKPPLVAPGVAAADDPNNPPLVVVGAAPNNPPPALDAGKQRATNLGDGRNIGVELEVRAQPLRAFEATASLSYLSSQAEVVGNAGVPDISAILERRLYPKLMARGSALYVSERYHFNVGAEVRWRPRGARWSFFAAGATEGIASPRRRRRRLRWLRRRRAPSGAERISSPRRRRCHGCRRRRRDREPRFRQVALREPIEVQLDRRRVF